MQVIEIKQSQKKGWSEFIRKNPYGSLLQSWEWGELQEALGQEVYRLAVIDKESSKERKQVEEKGIRNWELVAQIVKHKLPFGKSYLYCPRGPALNWNKEQGTRSQLKLLLDKIKEIAKQEKAIFLRIDPPVSIQSTDYSLQQIKKMGFMKGQKEIQPKCTLVLSIKGPEEEILAQMKSKTRYNIRLASKKKVKVKKSTDPKDVEIFWQLAHQTSERDAFFYHPKEHYQKMIEILGPKNLAKLFIAYYKDKPLACNIVTFFKNTAFYSHGASSSEHRNLMAAYIAQWEAICDAKKQGFKYYDFWGISEEDRSWAGITRFKRGFAPYITPTCYIGSQDLPYSKFWYKLYNLVHKIRKR